MTLKLICLHRRINRTSVKIEREEKVIPAAAMMIRLSSVTALAYSTNFPENTRSRGFNFIINNIIISKSRRKDRPQQSSVVLSGSQIMTRLVASQSVSQLRQVMLSYRLSTLRMNHSCVSQRGFRVNGSNVVVGMTRSGCLFRW